MFLLHWNQIPVQQSQLHRFPQAEEKSHPLSPHSALLFCSCHGLVPAFDHPQADFGSILLDQLNSLQRTIFSQFLGTNPFLQAEGEYSIHPPGKKKRRPDQILKCKISTIKSKDNIPSPFQAGCVHCRFKDPEAQLSFLVQITWKRWTPAQGGFLFTARGSTERQVGARKLVSGALPGRVFAFRMCCFLRPNVLLPQPLGEGLRAIGDLRET